MANIQRGIELCSGITDLLNNIISTQGKIEKDNKEIWDGLLHVLDNNDWEDIFQGFKTLIKQHTVFLTAANERKFLSASAVFQKDHHYHDRCMDVRTKTKNNKVHAWAMIMVIRETVNEINGQKVVNETKPKKRQPKVTIETTEESTRITIWHDLFEIK
jgi:hypothetical protein